MMRFTHRLTVWIMLFFVLAIRLAAPQTHVLSAIERVEMYTQTCSTLDAECVQVSENEINLGTEPSHELNLMYHLMGNTPPVYFFIPNIFLPAIYIPSKSYWHWDLILASIFHPPKYFS